MTWVYAFGGGAKIAKIIACLSPRVTWRLVSSFIFDIDECLAVVSAYTTFQRKLLMPKSQQTNTSVLEWAKLEYIYDILDNQEEFHDWFV